MYFILSLYLFLGCFFINIFILTYLYLYCVLCLLFKLQDLFFDSYEYATTVVHLIRLMPLQSKKSNIFYGIDPIIVIIILLLFLTVILPKKLI